MNNPVSNIKTVAILLNVPAEWYSTAGLSRCAIILNINGLTNVGS